jgi:hypothetical protein
VQESGSDEIAEVTTQATFTIPKINTSTSLSVRRIRGGYVASGRINKDISGRVVIERRAGNRWKQVKATITSSGYYQLTIYGRKKVTLRARYNGDSTYNGSTSKTRTVKPGRRR